jgi:hypothetical protein
MVLTKKTQDMQADLQIPLPILQLIVVCFSFLFPLFGSRFVHDVGVEKGPLLVGH